MRKILIAMVVLAFIFISHGQLWAARVKDIAKIGEDYEHQLIGYGVVVGLNGTGDSASALFTLQSVSNMLQRFGINISGEGVVSNASHAQANLKLRNVAAVVVTATLPPFLKKGNTIDVLVSSLGDATSLQGGTLLLTQLQTLDGKVIAFAQGPVSIGGFNAGIASQGSQGESMQKNHPTVGRIPNGALIQFPLTSFGCEERSNQAHPFSNLADLNRYEYDVVTDGKPKDEVVGELRGGTVARRNDEAKQTEQTLSVVLNKPDFTTAARLASIINANISENIATAVDAATVEVNIPTQGTDNSSTNLVNFISSIENLPIAPDTVAKVVIDERTGTVVMGENVQISTVAVAHGNLSIHISMENEISQPQPLSSGRTVVVPQTEVKVDEDTEQLMVVPAGVNISEVVKALNAIGATPRDLISILQAIKEAGALQAELIIM